LICRFDHSIEFDSEQLIAFAQHFYKNGQDEKRDAEARRTAEYWKAEHLAGNKIIARLNLDVTRYKFLRRLSVEPDLIELLNAVDANPSTWEEFDAAVDAAIASERRNASPESDIYQA
jgi:hypothetical protein